MIEWEFEVVLSITGGRTRSPVLRFRESATLAPRDMIVKLAGQHLIDRNLFCEYFGNVVAREMGLKTPEPHILKLNAGTVKAINSDAQVIAAGLVLQPGTAVGAEWLRPAGAPGVGRLAGERLDEAARIFAYDLMVQNPDRRISNPNVFEFSGHFVAFDFDLAFSFLYDVFPSPKPWHVSNLRFVYEHVFRSRLSKTSVDWPTLIPAMLSFDLQNLAAGLQTLPPAWHDDGAKVVAHLEALKAHATELAWEILGTLP